MSSRTCPSCGSNVSTTTDRCPDCGTSFEDLEDGAENAAARKASHGAGKAYVRRAIELFVLVGLSLGLIGAVELSQFGGGARGSFFFDSVLTASFVLGLALFLGPFVALLVNFSLVSEAVRNETTYPVCFLGNVAGHLLLMLTARFVLGVGTSIDITFTVDLLRMVYLSVPTGLTAVGGLYLATD